jgi:hypothetical protein
LGRGDSLNCVRSFFFQNWGLGILEIGLRGIIKKTEGAYILNCDWELFVKLEN